MKINIQPSWRSLGIIAASMALFFVVWFVLAGFAWEKAAVAALVIGAFTAVSLGQLRATINADKDVFLINYPLVSLKVDADELSSEASEKFEYRRDPDLGLNKLLFGTRGFGFHVGYYSLNDGSTAFVCLSTKKNARAIDLNAELRLLLNPGVAKRVSSFYHLDEHNAVSAR